MVSAYHPHTIRVTIETLPTIRIPIVSAYHPGGARIDADGTPLSRLKVDPIRLNLIAWPHASLG